MTCYRELSLRCCRVTHWHASQIIYEQDLREYHKTSNLSLFPEQHRSMDDHQYALLRCRAADSSCTLSNFIPTLVPRSLRSSKQKFLEIWEWTRNILSRYVMTDLSLTWTNNEYDCVTKMTWWDNYERTGNLWVGLWNRINLRRRVHHNIKTVTL